MFKLKDYICIKRQLLKEVMHIIHIYHKVKKNKFDNIQPRTFIFAAKAAQHT